MRLVLAALALSLAGCSTGGRMMSLDASGLGALPEGATVTSANGIAASPGSCLTKQTVELPTSFATNATMTIETGTDSEGNRYQRTMVTTNPDAGVAAAVTSATLEAFKLGMARSAPVPGAPGGNTTDGFRSRGPTTSPDACSNEVAGLQWAPQLGMPGKLEASE